MSGDIDLDVFLKRLHLANARRDDFDVIADDEWLARGFQYGCAHAVVLHCGLLACSLASRAESGQHLRRAVSGPRPDRPRRHRGRAAGESLAKTTRTGR